ncbi:ClpX C4-type zinc finger protein [Ancylobacter sp. IITR112]|uniref:ClpX C4-type zinc finger protein n=1 Tax=Ancylobacter sp. IITR112 TaxID=3138073 RepID=UPI00352B4F6E
MGGFPKHLCTFCGTNADQVRYLIAGPNHQFICDGCVTLCADICRMGIRRDDMIARLLVWRQQMTPGQAGADIGAAG